MYAEYSQTNSVTLVLISRTFTWFFFILLAVIEVVIEDCVTIKAIFQR